MHAISANAGMDNARGVHGSLWHNTSGQQPMIVILAMGIGLFAPPFGAGYYGACAIGRISPDDALWRIWPYIGALVIALAIVAAVPWLSIGFL